MTKVKQNVVLSIVVFINSAVADVFCANHNVETVDIGLDTYVEIV